MMVSMSVFITILKMTTDRDKRGVPALCDGISIKPTEKNWENGEKLRGAW